MRILLLHATVGQGHKSAALAIEQALKATTPAPAILTLDALDYFPKTLRSMYEGGYEQAVRRYPWLYGLIFQRTHEIALSRPFRGLRRAFNRRISKRLYQAVRGFRPDLILCTHFMPLSALVNARKRGLIDVPICCVVTDFGVHGYWVEKTADRYFVGSPESALALVRQGIAKGRIAVTGIPVRAKFQDPPTRDDARRILGIDPDRFVALVMAGGLGMGPVERVVKSIGGARRCEQLVVCGRNEELRANVAALAARDGIAARAIGFTDEVPLLMAAADVVVTKPGGLTTSEALAVGRPMLLFNAMPGQEEQNRAHLVRCGAAIAITPGSAERTIDALIDDPTLRARLAERAASMGHPEAAVKIAHEGIGMVPLARALPEKAVA